MIVPGSPNALLLAQSGDPLDEFGKIERSLRFRKSAVGHLTRTFGAPTSQSVYTVSAWVKRGNLDALNTLFGVSTTSGLNFLATGAIRVGTPAGELSSARLFRDLGAFYHVHYTQSGSNVVVYVNDQLVLSGTLTSTQFNTAVAHFIGAYSTLLSTHALDGLLAFYAFVDGAALPPDDFVLTHPKTGQVRPRSKAAIRAAVSSAGPAVRNGWGANGFFLPFDDVSSTAALGYDRSQSDTDITGNNWTATNISLTAGTTYDSMLDTPTNNFCTLNPIDPTNSATQAGNLQFSGNLAFLGITRATMPMVHEDNYCEVTVGAGTSLMLGVATSAASTAQFIGQNAYGWGYYQNGNKYNAGASAAYGATFTSGDVIGIHFKKSTGELTFYKNGVSQGVAYSGLLAGPYFFAVSDASGSLSMDCHINFGQRQFAYTPPTGSKPASTKNLPLSGGTVTVSGSFTGNVAADGPFVFCNGSPATLTINGNAVTFGTHADRLANGFKLRTASTSYNSSGTNTWAATILAPEIKSTFRYQNAKGNP